ncbi:MAG: hypothetical protein GXO89_07020 [Chlorobi bacterium]|nr:hypothetical protein [Chlorobiota bacterium]
MQTIVIKTDNTKNATLLADFLKSLQYVKSVAFQSDINEKVLKAEDWAKPGRPATYQEVEDKLVEAENSMDLSVAEAKEHAYKIIESWQRESK